MVMNSGLRRSLSSGRPLRAGPVGRIRNDDSGSKDSHPSTLGQQHIEIGGGTLAEMKSLAARRPSPNSMVTNSHSALSFEEAPNRASMSVTTRGTRMLAQRAPSPPPGSAT